MDDVFKRIEKFNVSRETFTKFAEYKTFLAKWQRQINLVSNESLRDFWERHLLDSLQLMNYITSGVRILDVGSGGGFPGAVLAICGEYNVTCVESDFRKSCFLRSLFAHLGVKSNVINDRVENIEPKLNKFDVITARGFSQLVRLLDIVERFNAIGVFLKGKNINNEIYDAKNVFSFDYELNKSETCEDGCVLVIKRCRKKQL